MISRLLAAVAFCLTCGEAGAVALQPPGDTVGFRAYALGIIPVDGQFVRFHGELSFDDPARCHLALTAETASLKLSSAERTQQVVGPEFLDAPRFPELSYDGACADGGMKGVLTLHGVSRALDLKVIVGAHRFEAEGQALRADWGITAEPVKIGPHLRLSVSLGLP